jgi:hypothetical protein
VSPSWRHEPWAAGRHRENQITSAKPQVNAPDEFSAPTGCVFARQELPFGDEQRHERWTPGAFPVSERDLGLTSVHRLRGDFEIDACIGVQLQSQTCPTVEHPGSEELAQFGDQGIESGIRGRWSMLGPDGFDEFVATGGTVAFEDEVGEQEPPLASRETILEPRTGEFDDGRAA